MKKALIAIAMIICIFSLLLTSNKSIANIEKRVIIDAGHGGMDAGASVGNINEDDLNLEIAYELKSIFEDNGFIADLTREDENDLCDGKFVKRTDMNKRLKMINSGSYFLCISIHQNKYSNSKYSGAQVFYSTANPNNKALAEGIQESIKTYLNNTDRIVQKRNNIYLLNKASIPACLVECGFMSNPLELKLLMDKAYQYKLASSIYYGSLTLLKTLWYNKIKIKFVYIAW